MCNARCSKINKTWGKNGLCAFLQMVLFLVCKNNLYTTLEKLRINETGDKQKKKLMKEI